MRNPLDLISELSYCDPATHIFFECRKIMKFNDKRILGLYGQRLDCCNMKFRFAAKSYLEVILILNDLEHGEFIYFDDESRLKVSFYVENLMIFLRASLDLAISAYCIYFNGETNIDSFNVFLKNISKYLVWLPSESKAYWNMLYSQYKSDQFEWLHTLVGSNKGMSLRDLAVHKSLIEIDTGIDHNDRGYFYIKLNKDNYGNAQAWIKSIYQSVVELLDMLKSNIENAEKDIENAK